ncbi:MAG: methylated-DNA--[protein]-cysteine S-methyltransferase [Anaerolineae bacterium]|nr:methylated-DNA--[protein]-cysteine S-methyltransferase [Anaerolineae bacterium]
MSAEPSFCVTRPSPFGTFSIVWRGTASGPRVYRIFLSSERASAEDIAQAIFPGVGRKSHPAIAGLGERIESFLEGHAVSFGLDLMALDGCSDFQRRVVLAEYGIPRGWVSTYGRIAKHLGVEMGARAVGNALARNPFPIVIPCHRAIRSNGELGGYQGGLAMKRALLAFEGVRVSETGKVLTQRVCY